MALLKIVAVVGGLSVLAIIIVLTHYCSVCTLFHDLFRWNFALCVYTIYCMLICSSWMKYWKCSRGRLMYQLFFPSFISHFPNFLLYLYFLYMGSMYIYTYILYILWKPAIKTILLWLLLLSSSSSSSSSSSLLLLSLSWHRNAFHNMNHGSILSIQNNLFLSEIYIPKVDVAMKMCWMILRCYSFLLGFKCIHQLYSSGFPIS